MSARRRMVFTVSCGNSDEGYERNTNKDLPLTETEISVEGAEKAFLKVEHTFSLAT